MTPHKGYTKVEMAKPKSKRKLTRVQVYFAKKAEVDLVQRAADLERRSVSFFAREAIVAAARNTVAQRAELRVVNGD